ncbi:Cytochrome P450 CYP4L11 [Operophtera brumata]|uniref:Cytochrome P450 CYP4L11 n=1 Tax=Operophtera brumata TaxID=104452 RepID=A0A0L7KP66_OPEBR|nr:Cytochrome P450 CYP4L11 [Operophtera brumata]
MRNPFVAEEIFFNILPYKSRQDKALAVLHGQTTKVIEARRDELKRNNITCLPSETEMGIKNKHAFLDLLLLSEIDGVKIDDESVREEGHDTTTSGIVFCLYCVSKHEDVQNKILKELQEILGDDLNRDPSYTSSSGAMCQ